MPKDIYPCKTLNDVLYKQSKETEKGLRFIKSSHEEDFVSYADFYTQVLLYLGDLERVKGLKKQDEIIIYEEDNHKFLVGYWACLLGGYVPIPISVGGKDEHKLKFFRIWSTLTNPYIFSSTTSLTRLLSFGIEKKLIDRTNVLEEKFLNSSETFTGKTKGIPVTVAANNLAFVQYSSGSTGNPKGVMLTHENLVYNMYDSAEALVMTSEDSYLSWIPLTHDLGMIAVHLTTMLTGGNQIIMPTSLFIRRPLLWMQKAHEHKVTRLCSPNFGYQYFLQSYTRNNNEFAWDLSNVRTILNGAEPISSKTCLDFETLLSKYKLPLNSIKPCYGLAEASVALTLVRTKKSIIKHYVNRKSLSIENALVFEENYVEGETVGFVNVGSVITNSQIVINNEKGDPLPHNVLGFIDIKGKNVTKGYYKNATATKEAFVKGGWLRTGDLGFIRKDGTLVITGRQKNMIILQGQNYYAHDIEDIIIGTADITLGKVAVCGISGNEQDKEKLLVFVYYKKKTNTFVETIIAIQERLSNALGIIPEVIIPVKEIPKTTSGKVQHSFLLKKYEQGVFNEVINDVHSCIVTHTIENWITSTNPINEISTWLEKQSKQLLHLTDFNLILDVPLADQGFKSIHALQLSQLIKTRLGINTTPTILYKYPTIYKLSTYIYSQLFDSDKDTSKEKIVKDDIDLLQEIESLSEEDVLRMLEL